MKFIDSNSYVSIELEDKDIQSCKRHAQKMADGFPTYSFKEEKSQSVEAYTTGKIGEAAVYYYLKKIGVDRNKITMPHIPFRESYEKLNFDDDFIIEKNGKRIKIEVRTKGRICPPKYNYDTCTDCIKPNLIYLFCSHNENTNIVDLVGWANWQCFKNNGKEIRKGEENTHFKYRSNEFQLEIQHLKNMSTFFDEVNGYENNTP